MAGWSMEPAAVWMPAGDLQLPNWTSEPDVYAPGIPAMDNCHHQVSIPICEVGQQREYEVVATRYDQVETTEPQFVVDFHRMEMVVHENDPIYFFTEVKWKMHRYPASIRAICHDERYTAPTVVAIGPYHLGGNQHMKQAEMMKHVAAFQCIKDSGCSLEDMYNAVVQVAHPARKLYDQDVMASIGANDFLCMMFFDACFLVQYMVLMSDYSGFVMAEQSLVSFLDTNDNEIFHDIMLLENQIPWPVVEAIMMFRPVDLGTVVHSLKGRLQEHKSADEKLFRMDHSYKPPHLLGLLRYHVVGRNKAKPDPLTRQLSFSAHELVEIDIKLKPNEKGELMNMGVKMKPFFGGELFLAPLYLDIARASCYVSMAALEMWTTPNFQDAEDEDSAVCSYLLLLAKLVAREEDVQKLRTQNVLREGLTDKEVLDFFKSLHGLRLGSCYVRTTIQIQHYKSERWMWTTLYRFWYRNKKTLATVIPIFLTLVGILVSLLKFRRSP